MAALTTLQKWEYLASYGDLINAFGPDADKAYNHFHTFTTGTPGDPGTGHEIRPITFDAWEYLASYDDLMHAFGADPLAAAKHYVTWGFDEGRDPNAFDAQAYLNNYTDLQLVFGSTGAAALVKAEQHYVEFGRAEGRNDYTLAANSSSVNEGHTVQFVLDTHDLAAGSHFSYGITGVTLADLDNGDLLSGTATVGTDGKATISVDLAADKLTEGTETLTLTVAGHSQSVSVLDSSTTPIPTYALTASPSVSVNEGQTVAFTLATTEVPAGSTFSYIITGVDAADVVGGSLSGVATIGTDGKAVVSVNLAEDAKTEGAETLTLAVAGQTAHVTVNDTSVAAIPTYALTASPTSSVNEGNTVDFTLATTGVPVGSTFAYTITGVDAADVLGGSLSGVATIGTDGKAVVSVSVIADKLTEGAETLTLAVAGQTAHVTVNDTSLAPVPTYALTASPSSSVDEGQTVSFTLVTTDVPEGSLFAYNITGGVDAADVVGGVLSGVAKIGADGKAIISVDLAADVKTEGAETLTLTVAGRTASVTVNDTSILDPVGTFTLTSKIDTETADIFLAPQRYTPGGNDLVNTLQDGDTLTGSGTNRSLTATIGDSNDAASYDITPTLHGIKTVNVAFVNGDGTFLDLQDSDASLTDVNVTRISTKGSHVVNLWSEAVNLTAAHSHDIADMEFSYINGKLAGTQTVYLLLTDVTADHLILGAENIQSQQIETLNLTVAADGASSVNRLDLRPDNLALTTQQLNIVANDSLIIGEDWDLDAGEVPAIPAIPAVPGWYGHPAVPELAGHDLGYIEHNNGLTHDTVESLSKITINSTVAGDVTLASVGNVRGFVLDGVTANGAIAVNISNAAGDYTAKFYTGNGNDTVLVDEAHDGYDGYGAPDGGPGAGNQVTLAGEIITGAGSDVVIAHDLGKGTVANEYTRSKIYTGEGSDAVVVGTLLGGPGIPGGEDFSGALINTGTGAGDTGNDSVTANNLQEEAQILTGSGTDVVDLTTTVWHKSDGHGGIEPLDSAHPGSGYVIIAGDSTGLYYDGNGAEVWLGAGNNDKLTIHLTGDYDHSLTHMENFGLDGSGNPISLIEGYVDGGAGTGDELVVDGNKSGYSDGTGHQLDVVNGSTGHDKAVTGIEIVTLNSTTAYDWDRVKAFNAAGDRSIGENDNNGYTADYHLDRSEFDSALTTINLNHEDGVIRNINPETYGWTAFAGSVAVDTLVNLNGQEQIYITALEAQTNNGTDTGTGAADDKLGTVYGPGTVGSCDGAGVPFTADLTVELALASTVSRVDIAHVTLNPVTLSDDNGDSPLDPGDVNYDVSINDLQGAAKGSEGGAGGSSNLYESLYLTVNGFDNHGVDLNNDFAKELKVTGQDNIGGNLTLINVNAKLIDTTGYRGNVYVGVESGVDHSDSSSSVHDGGIYTGIGNDIVRLGDQKAIELGKDYVSLGAGSDIVVFNGLGSGSVNNAGLTVADTVIGGSGDYDILAIGGETSYDSIGDPHGVYVSTTELGNVYGIEAIQLSVGQANPGYPDPLPVSYRLTLTDEVFQRGTIDANGDSTGNALRPQERVLDIINNNTEVSLLHTPSGCAPIHESNATIDIQGFTLDDQITYDGAIGTALIIKAPAPGLDPLGTPPVETHGSDDRFIFSDTSLDGRDTIDGGAADGSSSTYGGNNDVLEIRNAANVTGWTDFAHVTNVGTIAFNNDKPGTQTLIISLNDGVVDNMVDSYHSSASHAETLNIIANDGKMTDDRGNHTDPDAAALLNLDAHWLSSSSNLSITLDTQYEGIDIIRTGGGADTVYGISHDDVLDLSTGIDSVYLVNDFSDSSDAQLKGIEHWYALGDQNIDLSHQVSESVANGLDITIGGGGAYGDASVVGSTGTGDTLTFTNNYRDGGVVPVVGNWLGDDSQLVSIEKLIINGYSTALDVRLGAQTEAFDIKLSDNGDSIIAGHGNDTIHGGIGTHAEVINGRQGNDTIILGATHTGVDTIVFDSGYYTGILTPASGSLARVAMDGVDTITNFIGNHDKFNFSEADYGNLNGGVGVGTVTVSHVGLIASTAEALNGINVGTLGTSGALSNSSYGAFVAVGTNVGVGNLDIYWVDSSADLSHSLNALAVTDATHHAELIAHVTTIGTVLNVNDFVSIA